MTTQITYDLCAQMDEISNVRLFVDVVEAGSLSAAARGRGVTPSAVSRQISHLEQELDTRLFQRTTRKQALTEAGELYYEYAKRITGEIDAATDALAQLSQTPSGLLRVTAEADLANYLLARLLPVFLDRHPQITLDLSVSAGLTDLIEGRIDVAIRMGHLTDSSLIARQLAVSRSHLYASPAYIDTHGTPTHPAELPLHHCLSFRPKNERAPWRFQSNGGEIAVDVAGCVNVNSLSLLRSMAIAGRGIAMLPSWIVRPQTQEDILIQVLADYPLIPASTPISAVFAHNRHLAPKVRAFVDYVAAAIDAS